MMIDDGRSLADAGSGLRPSGAEPAAQSQAEPLVPNAAAHVVLRRFNMSAPIEDVRGGDLKPNAGHEYRCSIRDEEREAVVSWIRLVARARDDRGHPEECELLMEAADCIERGEHLYDSPDPHDPRQEL